MPALLVVDRCCLGSIMALQTFPFLPLRECGPLSGSSPPQSQHWNANCSSTMFLLTTHTHTQKKGGGGPLRPPRQERTLRKWALLWPCGKKSFVSCPQLHHPGSGMNGGRLSSSHVAFGGLPLRSVGLWLKADDFKGVRLSTYCQSLLGIAKSKSVWYSNLCDP